MPLMERLKGIFFHQLSPMAQQEQVKFLQLLRTNEIKLARAIKKAKPRKTTAKKATSGKKRSTVSAEAKALKALEKLSLGQLANLTKLLKN